MEYETKLNGMLLLLTMQMYNKRRPQRKGRYIDGEMINECKINEIYYIN